MDTLPANAAAIVEAIVQLSGAVVAVIALTGLGKLIAERLGHPIDGDKVRAVSAAAAVVVVVVAGVLGATIPGVGPVPASGEASDWAKWIATSAAALVLFANVVWRYAYKRAQPAGIALPLEPEPVPVTPPKLS